MNETENGLIIYQPATDRVHHLNNTAALVLQLCDGSRDVAEIAAMLGEAFGLDSLPSIETEQCVAQLRREGLLA